ncbi:hypothetical protein WG915_00220 [Corynebacterium sp. H128]|uniref:hypothetical protein n=1 Tax=Corynebacterium sp. H128 TaxID=3133427 RepID=UPI0030B7148B
MKASGPREQIPVVVEIVMAVALTICLVFLFYEASVPGGAHAFWFIGLMLAFPVFGVLYLTVIVVSIAGKRIYRSLIWPLLVLAFAALVLGLGISERIHWPVIKADLEHAIAAGQCPSTAGLTRDIYCTDVAGNPAFDLGGGFVDSYYVVHAPGGLEVPQHMELRRDLGDSWYLVFVPFD